MDSEMVGEIEMGKDEWNERANGYQERYQEVEASRGTTEPAT